MLNQFMQTFESAWKQFLDRLFKMNGRSSRTEYNCVMIPILLVIGILQSLADFLIVGGHAKLGVDMAMFAIVFIILMMIGGFCLVARRNQDVGISKWYVILMFIPQLGYLYLVIMMFLKPDLHFHFFPHHHQYLN